VQACAHVKIHRVQNQHNTARGVRAYAQRWRQAGVRRKEEDPDQNSRCAVRRQCACIEARSTNTRRIMVTAVQCGSRRGDEVQEWRAVRMCVCGWGQWDSPHQHFPKHRTEAITDITDQDSLARTSHQRGSQRHFPSASRGIYSH